MAQKKLRTIKLDPEFEDQLKATAYWARTSVNAMIEEGAAIVMKRLEKHQNNGQPFPPIPAEDKKKSKTG